MKNLKVFISYSHDSDDHKKRVLDLSNKLRESGIDCDIDQYNPAPQQGWPRWMMQSIQEADYVLLVCTETYRRRLELELEEERGKGLGVKWEGSLIFNALYRNETVNTKFIPIVFEVRDKAHIPDVLFGYESHDLSQARGYENLYRHIRGSLGAAKPQLGKKHYIRTIYSNALPAMEGELFGRRAELALLDTAWADPQTHIVQLVAAGGTGKTKLLDYWLDHTDDIEALIAWSFYSQGSSEDRQVSASPFFSHAFATLKSDKTTFHTEEEKGEHLAHLLRQRRCLLVLDGLEPLQYVGKGLRGELKDRAIRSLLKSLAGDHNSLCIITTRIAVYELLNRAHTISHDLKNLAPEDGIVLLQSLGVHGSPEELKKAVMEYECHALALHLLGNALRTYLDGDVRKRDTLPELIDHYDDISRHAFKVMQAYTRWLADTPELKLLLLLGLFDHPIETEALQVLWRAQLPGLTARVPEKSWKVAIRDLREKHYMLSVHESRIDLLDCHPLIREYFGAKLKAALPDIWQRAHERLYDYYKALPDKEFPDTLEEMRPLFSAVAHGCMAGLHLQTLFEVFWPRIRRKEKAYVIKKLGAYSDYLAALAHFFDKPWSVPVDGLSEAWTVEVLNWAGFSLRALGRLSEAEAPMQGNIELAVHQGNWLEAAIAVNNFCELKLVTGDIRQSIETGRLGLIYADKSEDSCQKMINRATLANVFHQAAQINEAVKLFEEAELLQQKHDPQYPHLSSLYGYQYCELLLEQNIINEVRRRFDEFCRWRQPSDHLLKVAAENLVGGRLSMRMGQWDQAIYWLNLAVSDLRMAGCIWLPFGLLPRASCFCRMQHFEAAHSDLNEVLDIAERSEMRLHLADYHLESARLALSKMKGDKATEHTQVAAELITATGYIRRLPELKVLQDQIMIDDRPGK